MTPRQRLVLFSVAVTGLVGCYLWAFAGLPGFGNYPGPYGQAILAHAIAQTHATGVVSAINFEYRGFDTVGEEFILFTAAAGMSVVLRRLRNERKDPPEQLEAAAARDVPRTSPAVRGVALLLVAPTVVLGWWLATHAQTNPSGGFQGGVVLATAFMLVYLSGDLRTARRLRPEAVVDAAEAVGAGGFASADVVAIIAELLEQSPIVRQPAPPSPPPAETAPRASRSGRCRQYSRGRCRCRRAGRSQGRCAAGSCPRRRHRFSR